MNLNSLKGFLCCLVVANSLHAQTITSQPQSVVANYYSSAIFSVGAVANSTYQWQLDGQDLPAATNYYLFFDNLATNEAGTYTVVVTPPSGPSVTSSPATLTLVPGTVAILTITNFAAGTSSNVTMQLFDHDKPATVANFIHYINSGAYSNMFFDRLVPGFVLQGGTYYTEDMTNTTPGLTQFSISNSYEINGGYMEQPFPDEVVSEYYFDGYGFTPNTFGTLAMALNTGNVDSANCAFFINLADNSSILDSPQDFTVFGRVLQGSSVLQYFNTFQSNNGIVDYGNFIVGATETTLPVNYSGNQEPSDANLYYCDITLSNAPTYNASIQPTAAITYPAANEVVTNGLPLTIQGTAATNQWTGIARVRCDVIIMGGIYNGQDYGGDASGTTNWSLFFGTFPAGFYQLQAFAQDGYGIESPLVSEYFSVWGLLSVTVNGDGSVSTQPGIPLAPHLTYFTNTTSLTPYSMTAKAAAGQVFAGWSNGGTVSLNPKIEFGTSNTTLTATFIPDNMPKGVTFTYPPANADLTNVSLILKGNIPSSLNVTQLTCQLFLQSNSITLPQPVARTAKTWSLAETNLVPGPYTAVLTAYDSDGRSRLIFENFNIMTKLTVTNVGLGSISPKLNGKYLVVGKKYSVTATPAHDYIFAYWSQNVATNRPTTSFIMEPDMTLMATFVTNPFPSVAGVYHGLFLSGSNTSVTNSGSISLTTTGTGAFSGSLDFLGLSYPIHYKFPYYGSIILGAPTKEGTAIYIYLNLDVSQGSDSLTGGIVEYSSAGILWSNPMVAYRGVSKLSGASIPVPGKYDLLFASNTNGPVADGYAALNVGTGGGMTLVGALTNAPFSLSTTVSKNGIWPIFYAPARYKGQAMLIGWATNSTAGCNGQLFWVNDGTVEPLTLTGTNYAAPLVGADYVISFQGGSLGATIQTNSLTINKSHQFVSTGLSARDFGISISGAGVVTGHIATDGITRTFQGVFSSDGQSGAGFFLEPGGEVGNFVIDPLP